MLWFRLQSCLAKNLLIFKKQKKMNKAFDFYLSLAFCLFCRGYNIGIRLIDEFLAKSGVSRCVDFKETAEMIAKVLPLSHSLTFSLFLDESK